MAIRARMLLAALSLGCWSAWSLSQAPVVSLADELQAPGKLPEKAEAQPPKKDEPPAQPLTFPVADTPAPNVPLSTSGSSVQVSALPPVFGDCLTGSRYSPYLVATTPTGQQASVRPGQTQLFPLGTTFDRPVQTRIVTVVTDPGSPGQPPNGSVPPREPIREQFLEVTGTPAVAHSGGLPVNVARGAFKIAENESPRPVDRIYATYHFFSDVNPTLSVPELPVTNVHRETLGFEKTFLNGDASIGMRLPFIQINGPLNLQAQSVGDVSVIFKYAFINDLAREDGGPLRPGNVLSGGLVVTAPTGNTAAYSAQCPIIHSTLLQPWVGGILVSGRSFLQGFSSLAVPTDDRDTTFFFNSVQLGYRLWESPNNDRLLTALYPIVECHVNTPLNNRGLDRLPIGATDFVTITGGATFCLGSRSALNLGANTSVTGPRPYVVEAMAQLNINY